MMLATGAVLVAAGTTGLPMPAGAQVLREGRDYRVVRPAQPTEVPAGKIEAIEFFWYGCPHCNSLEPALEQWVKKLPDDVVFRRIHVPFGERRHQQLFYTLESMGKDEELHKAVFHAIHVDRDRLDTVDRMVAMLSKHGVDEKQFRDTFDSFAVRTKMRRAAQVVDAYGVEGVPAMAVAGKYYTAPSMVGSNGGALQVMDQLIEIERKAAKK
ncbi:MAG: thiol:disulfide interchange protein DsbA/DsbL [Limnobacter sp.]|nr:thiol:disulfide interchange protein DsbA/DsbL [Limnobacter sp.]